MRARWLEVLGSREQHLWRTCRETRPLIAFCPLSQRCRYSTREVRTSVGAKHPSGIDSTSTTLSIHDRRLLGRARLHGIHSLDQLRFEADLGHVDAIGSRILDQPTRRQDLDLWLFLLEVNRQFHGLKGVKAIWNGLLRRGAKVKLESDNANARDLIDAFIYAGITEDIQFLKAVVTQCMKLDYFTADLFVAVIGGLLRHRPESAPGLARSMQRFFYQGRSDLLQVFRSACESGVPHALKHFYRVRNLLPEAEIYHDTVPYLWELGRAEDAFGLHHYLLARDDLPKAFAVLVPFIGYLAHAGQDLKPFLRDLENAGVDFSNQAQRVYRQQVEHLLQHPPGNDEFKPMAVPDQPQSKLQDHTIARALATTAFSFDFVINAICLFGAVEFGPLAVRQLVLTSSDLPTLNTRFERLHTLGIDTGASQFVTIIRRLLQSGNFDLMKLLAESDMHHDEFADRSLQRRLLSSYSPRTSQLDITRTLTILNRGHTGRDDQEYSTSLLLRSAAIRHDWQLVLDIVVSLHRTGHRVTRSTLGVLARTLLPSPCYTVDGFRLTLRDVPSFDTLSFFIGLLQQLLATRTNVLPSDWFRPLFLLGQHQRLDELHSLALFLARCFQTSNNSSDLDSSADLSRLFTPHMQCALIAWDFTARKWRRALFPFVIGSHRWRRSLSSQTPGFSPDELKATAQEPWLHGARLLKRLRDEYHVTLDFPALTKQYLFRIRQMAAAEGSWKVSSNKHCASLRGYRYQDFVEGWEDVWRDEHDDYVVRSAPPLSVDNVLGDDASHASSPARTTTACPSSTSPVSGAGGGRLAKGVARFLRHLQRGKGSGAWQVRRRRRRSRYLTGPPVRYGSGRSIS